MVARMWLFLAVFCIALVLSFGVGVVLLLVVGSSTSIIRIWCCSACSGDVRVSHMTHGDSRDEGGFERHLVVAIGFVGFVLCLY